MLPFDEFPEQEEDVFEIWSLPIFHSRTKACR
jgi:hypothetical protein